MIPTEILELIGLIIIALGGVGAFYTMQTRQNMKIAELEKAMEKLEDRLSKTAGYQIETEKAIVAINEKLAHIAEAIDELKRKMP